MSQPSCHAQTRQVEVSPFRPPPAGGADREVGAPLPPRLDAGPKAPTGRNPHERVLLHTLARHEKARPSPWHGAASSALVSRSRAMPAGGRRSAVARHPGGLGPRRLAFSQQLAAFPCGRSYVSDSTERRASRRLSPRTWHRRRSKSGTAPGPPRDRRRAPLRSHRTRRPA